jgi:hypothetical protein
VKIIQAIFFLNLGLEIAKSLKREFGQEAVSIWFISTHTGRRGTCIGYWQGSQRERGH